MEHHTCGSPVVQLLGECSSSGSSLLPRPRLSDTPRRRQEHPTAETAHASRLTTSLSNTPARNHVLSPTPLDLHPVVTPRIDSRGEARVSASPSATPTTAAATAAVGDGAAAAAAMPTRDTLYATTWWLNHPSDYDAISAPPRRRGKRLNPLRLKEPQMIPYEVAWPSNDSRVAAPRHANAVPQRQAQAAPPQRQSDPVAAQRLQQQQQQQQRQRELDQQRQQEQRQRELQQQQIQQQQQQQQRQRETAQQERQRPLSPRAPPAKATPQLESKLAPRRLSEAQPNRDAVASSKSQHLPAPPPRHSASTDSSRGAQAPPPGRVLVPFGVASPNLTPSPNSVAPRAATNSQSAAYRDAYPPSSTTDGGDGTRMMGSHTPLLQEQQQPLPHAQAQPHVDEQLQQVHSTSELAPSQTVAAAVPGAADSNSPHNNHSQENGFISPCCINSESDQVSNLEEKDHRAPSRSTSGLLHDQGVILGTPTHSTPRRIMFPSEAQQRAQLLPPSSRTNNSSAERDPQASTQSPAADLVRSPDGMRSEVAPHRRTPEMAEMAAHHSALPQPSNDYLSPQDQDEEEMVALPRSMARRGSVAAAEEPLSSPNAEEHNDDGSAAVSRSRRAARPQTNPSGSFSDPQHSQPSHTFHPPRAPAGPSSPALQIIGSYPSLAQPRRVPFSSEVRHQAQHTSPREYEEEEVAPTSPPTVVSRSRRPVVPITDLPEKEAEEEERPPTQRSILMRPTRIVEDGENPQDGYLSHRSRPGPLSPSQIAQLQDDGRSAMNARRPRSVVTVFSNEGSSTPPAHINQLSVHPQNLEVESSIPYAIHRPSERAPPQ